MAVFDSRFRVSRPYNEEPLFSCFELKYGRRRRRSPVHTGNKVQYGRLCCFGPVHGAHVTLVTKSNVSATKSTTTSCQILVVADLLPKPATESTVLATVDFVADLLPVSATVDFVSKG